MTDKFVYIPNDYIQNDPFCRLQLIVETFDTQLNEPTNQNSIKVVKDVKPTSLMFNVVFNPGRYKTMADKLIYALIF